MECKKFKVGDLILLNDFGMALSDKGNIKVGVIVAGPYNFIPYKKSQLNVYYWVYDIMIGRELFILVPQSFMERITTNEKDSQ